MIVRSQDGKRKSFHGVDFIVLSHGPESMVTKMLYKPGDHVPFHSHPHEQSGYVLNSLDFFGRGGEIVRETGTEKRFCAEQLGHINK